MSPRYMQTPVHMHASTIARKYAEKVPCSLMPPFIAELAPSPHNSSTAKRMPHLVLTCIVHRLRGHRRRFLWWCSRFWRRGSLPCTLLSECRIICLHYFSSDRRALLQLRLSLRASVINLEVIRALCGHAVVFEGGALFLIPFCPSIATLILHHLSIAGFHLVPWQFKIGGRTTNLKKEVLVIFEGRSVSFGPGFKPSSFRHLIAKTQWEGFSYVSYFWGGLAIIIIKQVWIRLKDTN